MSIEKSGPPRPGPIVTVTGEDMKVTIRVNDDLDELIVKMAMEMAERRRRP